MTTGTLDRSPRTLATDVARATALIAGVLYRVTFVRRHRSDRLKHEVTDALEPSIRS